MGWGVWGDWKTELKLRGVLGGMVFSCGEDNLHWVVRFV